MGSLSVPLFFMQINYNMADIYCDSEMFARTKFSLIFTNVSPREFNVLANIESTSFWIAILVN